MNINKLIAFGIHLFVFLVPFRILFFTDEYANSMKHVMLLLSCIFGFLIAFGIGTNQPFGRNQRKAESQHAPEEMQHRKAA